MGEESKDEWAAKLTKWRVLSVDRIEREEVCGY